MYTPDNGVMGGVSIAYFYMLLQNAPCGCHSSHYVQRHSERPSRRLMTNRRSRTEGLTLKALPPPSIYSNLLCSYWSSGGSAERSYFQFSARTAAGAESSTHKLVVKMPFMPRWKKNKPRNISDIIAFLESGVTSPGEPTGELASPLLDAEASAVAQEEYMLARGKNSLAVAGKGAVCPVCSGWHAEATGS